MHTNACRRVAFRGLGYGGGGGDNASSSLADAASGSGAARRVGGATGAEAPTGDVDRPGGGTKPGMEGVCRAGSPRPRRDCSTIVQV